VKVIDIERSRLLESHKSSENVEKLRSVFVDSEFDYPKGGVRIKFTCISGQTNFKRLLCIKTFWKNCSQECLLKKQAKAFDSVLRFYLGNAEQVSVEIDR
jgi:hypothetical protein